MAHFDGFLSKGLAVHPPLRLQHGLNDIARLTVRTLELHSDEHDLRTCRWELAWGYPSSLCTGPAPSVSSQPLPSRGNASFPAVDSGKDSSGYPRRGTHLEMWSSVCIESAIVVQNVYEIKLVSYSNVIIIWIVRGSDLHSTRPE